MFSFSFCWDFGSIVNSGSEQSIGLRQDLDLETGASPFEKGRAKNAGARDGAWECDGACAFACAGFLGASSGVGQQKRQTHQYLNWSLLLTLKLLVMTPLFGVMIPLRVIETAGKLEEIAQSQPWVRISGPTSP